MNVLIGCENSGIIRDEFTRRGHFAMSCDLLPSDRPGLHYQGDVRDLLYPGCGWDLFICHPDCTYLCSSGLHWNKRVPGRPEKTEAALSFVKEMMRAPIPRIAIENPVGAIGTRIDAREFSFSSKKASQYIQPYEYGHNASKRTGLWLKNLPPLIRDPSQFIEPRLVEHPAGAGVIAKRWGNQTDSGQSNVPPSADRWKIRAETHLGWAVAMAEQWGSLIPIDIYDNKTL